MANYYGAVFSQGPSATSPLAISNPTFVIAVLLSALVWAEPASATNRTWTDAGSSDMNERTNWSGGRVPTSADQMIFESDASISFQPQLTASISVLGISINNSGADWSISSADPTTAVLAIGANGLAITGGGATTIAGKIDLTSASQTWNIGTAALGLTGELTGLSGTVLTLSGTGVLTLSGGATATTFLGSVHVSGGTLVLSKNPGVDAIAGTLVIGDGVGGANADIVRLTAPDQITNAAAVQINSSGRLDLYGQSETIGSLSDGSSGGGNVALGTSAVSNLTVGDTSSTTFSGTISGAGNVIKQGSGSWTLSGASTYTGSTTISAGTLTVAATSGSALGTTSAVTVNSGGTLLFDANNQVNTAAPIALVGGTIAKGNFSQGSASAVGLGALSLTASGSRLDFGSGTVGVLSFASFDPGAYTLIIDNWTGTANTVGSASTDRLIFNASQAGNLNSFAFTGYAPGATQFDLGGGFWEIAPVTPVPEPATYVAGFLAFAAIAAHQRRRILALLKARPREATTFS